MQPWVRSRQKPRMELETSLTAYKVASSENITTCQVGFSCHLAQSASFRWVFLVAGDYLLFQASQKFGLHAASRSPSGELLLNLVLVSWWATIRVQLIGLQVLS
ncbi:unnamed protein product [Schistocephalus solidus]|uniref:Uncharacterized protein n=1 Tax=Schistocephalus solidus TaxID=70667 RepID=A0A183T6Y3_SCHSO|nr:unnamed protein product [Schistocephalus solidus]